MQGPHRKQDFSRLCAAPIDLDGDAGLADGFSDSERESCKCPASVGCLRCGAALCDRHIPSGNKRCSVCESEFDAVAPSRAQLIRTESRIFSGLGIGVGLAIGLTSSLGGAGVAVSTLIGFTAAHWVRMLSHVSDPDHAGIEGIAGWLERNKRRRFLGERGQHRLGS